MDLAVREPARRIRGAHRSRSQRRRIDAAGQFRRECREPGEPNASPTYTSARAPAHNARGLRVVRWLHVVAGERAARGVARGGARGRGDGRTANGPGIRVTARDAPSASPRDLSGGGVRPTAVSACLTRLYAG